MKSMQRRIKGIILFVCCIIYLFVGIQPMYTKAAEDNDHATENPIWVDSPSIMGGSGIVMEVSTGTILYEKNMHDIHYPASITKIMTVLLAIENCEMDEIVTVPPEAVYMEDKGSHIALDAGEQLTVEQCLYAIMLASANDAAYALAEHVGGTYENFIRMMNEEAKELGCENTNFTNPHGLPDENHVTSAYDMALITKAALQCDMFQTVSGTSYYEILPTEHQKDLICMYNHHKMIGKTEFQNEEVFAGKNGYTDDAGHTLVTCAKRDDMAVICVVMQDQGEHIYQDTLELLNYGLDCFKKEKINEGKAFFEEMLKKENPYFENCVISKFDVDNSYVIMPKGLNISDLNIKFDYGEAETVTAQYFYENHLVGQIGLVVEGIQSKSDSPEKPVKEPLSEEKESKGSLFNWKYIVFAIIVGIFIAGVVLKVFGEKYCGRNKKNRPGRKLKRKVIGKKWRQL